MVFTKIADSWAMFVAQLVEHLLPTPEICVSNPVIGNLFTINCIKELYWNDRKEKRGPFFKRMLMAIFQSTNEVVSRWNSTILSGKVRALECLWHSLLIFSRNWNFCRLEKFSNRWTKNVWGLRISVTFMTETSMLKYLPSFHKQLSLALTDCNYQPNLGWLALGRTPMIDTCLWSGL